MSKALRQATWILPVELLCATHDETLLVFNWCKSSDYRNPCQKRCKVQLGFRQWCKPLGRPSRLSRLDQNLDLAKCSSCKGLHSPANRLFAIHASIVCNSARGLLHYTKGRFSAVVSSRSLKSNGVSLTAGFLPRVFLRSIFVVALSSLLFKSLATGMKTFP